MKHAILMVAALRTHAIKHKRLLAAALALIAVVLFAWSVGKIGKPTPAMNQPQEENFQTNDATPRIKSPSISGGAHNMLMFDVKFDWKKLVPNTFDVKVGDTVHMVLSWENSTGSVAIVGLGLTQNVNPNGGAIMEFSTQTAGEYPITCSTCPSQKPIGKIRIK